MTVPKTNASPAHSSSAGSNGAINDGGSGSTSNQQTIIINGKKYVKNAVTGQFEELRSYDPNSQSTVMINGKKYKKDPKSGVYVLA